MHVAVCSGRAQFVIHTNCYVATHCTYDNKVDVRQRKLECADTDRRSLIRFAWVGRSDLTKPEPRQPVREQYMLRSPQQRAYNKKFERHCATAHTVFHTHTYIYAAAFRLTGGFVRFLFLPCANALALLRSRPSGSSFFTW